MFKKNSWIVALLLALALTAFFIVGCVDPLAVEPPDTIKEEIALGAFNTWGGQSYQRGWAVAGIVFDGVANVKEVAADKGYKNEDFLAAKYLLIEMPDDTYPKGGMDLIWGGEDANGSSSFHTGWNQKGVVIGPTGNAVKDGNMLKIDLTKALANYARYKTAAKLRIVIQYNQAGGPEGLVKSAKLLTVDPKYVGIKNMTLDTSKFNWTNELKLTATFTPDDATNQLVHWSIKSWKPEGVGATLTIDNTDDTTYISSKAALLAKVAFKSKKIVIRPGVDEVVQPDYTYTDWSVYPPRDYLVTSDDAILVQEADEFSYMGVEDDIIIATDGFDSLGTVTLVATVKNGIPVKNSDGLRTGTADYTKEFTVTITNPNAFAYKIDDSASTSVFWGGKSNASDGYCNVEVATDGATKYTVTMKGNGYGNSYAYVRYDLGVGKTLNSFQGVRFTYKGISGDTANKTIRVKALGTEPPVGYNPGIEVSRTGNDAIAGTGVNGTVVTLKFGERAGIVADGTHNFGTTESPDMTDFSGNLTTANGYGRYIYLWFLPWSDVSVTVFEISDVEFLTTVP